MKILHTSDWHIGQQLHSQKRYQEFEQFFQWLVEKIAIESFDVLLVAGDVFDTTTPSNQAQELYNNFLAEVSKTSCRHVVVTGGNHDSPSLLNSQRALFKLLQIHIVGSAEADSKEEVLVLRDDKGSPELIVCAVPYLRDRDVCKAEPGESFEEKGKKRMEGVQLHYAEVCAEAERIRSSLSHWVPIVAMGHSIDKDGYDGSLGNTHSSLFPSCIDYLALGHLHAPQKVAGQDFMRYSGSPLPMSFAEADQDKEIVCVECIDRLIRVEGLKVPRFQELKRIRGNEAHIFNELAKEKERESKAFLEVIYTGEEFIDHKFHDALELAVEGSFLKILKSTNERKRDRIIAEGSISATLDDLQPLDIFKRVLEEEQIMENEQEELISRFLEMVRQVAENDCKRE
jgi:exonuclease SbcD